MLHGRMSDMRKKPPFIPQTSTTAMRTKRQVAGHAQMFVSGPPFNKQVFLERLVLEQHSTPVYN